MAAKKILFADDDPEIRSVVRVLLESEGYEIVEAANGEEAVRLADETMDKVNPILLLSTCSTWASISFPKL